MILGVLFNMKLVAMDLVKLADEYTNSNATIPSADKEELRWWQQWGFFMNVDLTDDLSKILWKHFIGEPDYSYVGAYEGGYYYAYGVWRPEVTSLMINNIPYINAPGRELIVRRIKNWREKLFLLMNSNKRCQGNSGIDEVGFGILRPENATSSSNFN